MSPPVIQPSPGSAGTALPATVNSSDRVGSAIDAGAGALAGGITAAQVAEVGSDIFAPLGAEGYIYYYTSDAARAVQENWNQDTGEGAVRSVAEGANRLFGAGPSAQERAAHGRAALERYCAQVPQPELCQPGNTLDNLGQPAADPIQGFATGLIISGTGATAKTQACLAGSCVTICEGATCGKLAIAGSMGAMALKGIVVFGTAYAAYKFSKYLRRRWVQNRRIPIVQPTTHKTPVTTTQPKTRHRLTREARALGLVQPKRRRTANQRPRTTRSGRIS